MFQEHLQAGFPALWIQTHEAGRAISEWGGAAEKIGWKSFTWDFNRGLKAVKGNGVAKQLDPAGAVSALAALPEKSVLFALNFHKFIKAVDVMQELLNQVEIFKASAKCFVVISPMVDIPPELDKFFVVLRFELPTEETLRRVLEYMAESAGVPLPDDAASANVIESGKGLTAWEFENSLALSLVTKKRFDPEAVIEQKKQLVRKNASLTLETYGESLENLGGLENLKAFCLRAARSPLSKGVLLLGVPGTGKSHFAKGLGRALGVPTASLDFGRMFGSLVGESEQRIREALSVVDAFSPCVLFIDEIEKGLSGIASSGQTDGGTGSRVFGTFLNWLNDHKSRVFVVGTCNDITKMPPEFLRAERWDAIFFVDLPTDKERAIILELYKKTYTVDGETPGMAGWSGAEIRSLCRIAAMMTTSLQDAARYVVPLSQSMGEKIQELREWARARTIPASGDMTGEKPQKQIRRVQA